MIGQANAVRGVDRGVGGPHVGQRPWRIHSRAVPGPRTQRQ
jgi:hypothetical protein